MSEALKISVLDNVDRAHTTVSNNSYTKVVVELAKVSYLKAIL